MAVFNKLCLSVVLVLAAGTPLTLALSSSCEAALASFAVSTQAQCLAPASLAAVAVASGSVVSPVNNWLSQLCPQPACANATLNTVATNLSQSCASDLTSVGLTMDQLAGLPSFVQQIYPTVRQAACLSDTSNGNEFCVTETLTNLQPYTGTLSLANIMSIMTKAAAGTLPDVPSNVTCTDCTQATYDIINAAYPQVVSSSTNQSIAAQCGSTFLSSASPASISQSASGALASSSNTNTAASSSMPGVGAALFSAAAGFVFMMLA